jgi:acyl-CoA thioesterase-1
LPANPADPIAVARRRTAIQQRRWAVGLLTAGLLASVIALRGREETGQAGAPERSRPFPPASLRPLPPLARPPVVTLPRPVLDTGSAVASSGRARLAFDGDPASAWVPRKAEASWLSVRLHEPANHRLLIAWQARGYRYRYHQTAPKRYRLQVSDDSPDGRRGHWRTAATVDNRVGRRADLITAPGTHWLRVRIDETWAVAPSLTELGVFAVPDSGPIGCWFILGDSISNASFSDQPAWQPANRTRRQPLPVFINGGTSGHTAAEGMAQLVEALAASPPAGFIGIAYGTNDAMQAVPLTQFEGTLQRLITLVRRQGGVPMLARPPWNPNTLLPRYVAVIDRLTRQNGLPKGPDLFSWFQRHPEALGPDRLHPNAIGETAIRRLWSEAIQALTAL